MQSVIFDSLLRTTFECQHRSLSAGWHVHLLRRKSWCYDISSVVWKKGPRERNGAAWKCHMGFHRINSAPYPLPLFSTKNKLFAASQTASLFFVAFSWYIFSIAFRQNISNSRWSALSCEWVNIWTSIRIISIGLPQYNKQYNRGKQKAKRI